MAALDVRLAELDVFLVVVLLKPTVKQIEEEGLGAKIVAGPTAVTAKDREQAAMKAYRLVPEEHSDKEDRLEVRVLPFAK